MGLRVNPRARRLGVLVGMLSALGGGASAGAQLPQVPVRLPTTPPVRTLAPAQQGEGRVRTSDTADVPVASRPPAGMCRIWLDNVPAAQQPAPTECSVAVRNRPANGRVLFGDDYVGQQGRERGKGARGANERRPHGPSADESALEVTPEATPDVPAAVLVALVQPPVDSIRRPAQPRRPLAPVPRLPRRDAGSADEPEDDYEAGYRAGYEDAARGRSARVRGVVATGGVAGTGVTGALVVPTGDDPRYFNNGSFPPPGRANGVCLDRDQDGWCDDPRYGAPVCRDLDGDGRCDDYAAEASAPYPTTLPEMRAGVDVRSGTGSGTALRWLGTSEVVARPSGGRAGGTPYRILWYDANTNALLQAWTDRNGDGRADRVEIYRNGRRVKLLGS